MSVGDRDKWEKSERPADREASKAACHAGLHHQHLRFTNLESKLMAKFPFLAIIPLPPELGIFIGTIWIMFALSYGNTKYNSTNFWWSWMFADDLCILGRRHTMWGGNITNPRIWWFSSPTSSIFPSVCPEHPSFVPRSPGDLFPSWVHNLFG